MQINAEVGSSFATEGIQLKMLVAPLLKGHIKPVVVKADSFNFYIKYHGAQQQKL